MQDLNEQSICAIDCIVVVAHMDDEALSAGGYIQACVAERLNVAVVSVFGRKYAYGDGPQYEQEQRQAFLSSCEHLGVVYAEAYLLEEGEPQTHRHDLTLQKLEKLLAATRPTEVVIHDTQDRNQDHTWLSGVCKIALRPWANPWVSRVLMMQSPDGLPKETNWYVPMSSEQLETKLQAMAMYTMESRGENHPRSTRSLRADAVLCGSKCSEDFAEGFRLLYAKG